MPLQFTVTPYSGSFHCYFLEDAKLSPVSESLYMLILWGQGILFHPHAFHGYLLFQASVGHPWYFSLILSPFLSYQLSFITHTPPPPLQMLIYLYTVSPSQGIGTWSVLGVTFSLEFGTEPGMVGTWFTYDQLNGKPATQSCFPEFRALVHQRKAIFSLVRSTREPLNISPTRGHIHPEGKQTGSHEVKDKGWKIGHLSSTDPLKGSLTC